MDYLEIQDRRLGLVLRGSRHLSIYREVGQERLHLGRTHLLWMAFFVIQDETSNPVEVRLLSPDAVVTRAQMVAHAIQELWRLGGRHGKVSSLDMVERNTIREILGLPK